MKVKTLMTKEVHTCRAVDTLDDAVELMREHNIGSLPVVDENGHVVGMLTDRDVCLATHAQDAPPRAISVELTMSAHPTTCAPDDEVAMVEESMRRRQIHRVPVVDDAGHPVGILSLNDLAIAAKQGAGVSSNEVADTLAAVCAGRPLY